ncbi:MAG: acetolactate synthase small subunit [Clostridiales Family XIII bacterium]|jgi:acetolactate synthase-1/3 small subunit|nr:acetolactate synthase small subunit [Clostridiales Family XIII bacterium]
MKHTIAVLVENRAGVLSRISGLFARRGFNIDSLAVGPTDDPKISRMTIIVDGDDYTAEQVTKQLNKLIDVLKVRKLTFQDIIRRELLLVKVKLSESQRGEIVDIAKIMGCEMVDISHTTLMLEHSDRPEKIDLLIDLLSKYKILEITRTGTIALQRGADSV